MENEQRNSQDGAVGSYSLLQRIEKVLDILSKPVCLAVVSGLIITLLTAWVQSNADQKEKDREYIRVMREKKLQLLGTFDVAFNNSLGSELWYGKKLSWISSYDDHKLHPQGIQEFPGGQKEYDRAMDDLEKKWAAYSAMPTYGGLFAQVNSIFESQEVRSSLGQLQDEVEKDRSNEEIESTLRRVHAKTKQLLSAMGNEIRSDGMP